MPSTLHVGSHPGEYHTIQAAVDAAHSNDTIRVDPGTYTEQVVINNNGHARDNLKLEGSGEHSTIIKAPPLSSMTGHHAIVEVENARNVTIEDFTIEGPSSGANSGGNFYGVRVDNGSARIEDNHITKIEDTPFNGVQEGVAILVGRAADGTTGTAIISHNLIDDYQKAGIVVDNVGSSAEIDHNKILGQGPTGLLSQNGIQISRGATADVSNNRISDNEFTGGGDVGSGVLLFQAGRVRVDHNTLSHNDVGINDQGSDNAVMEHNYISENTTNGILLVSTSGARIDHNTIDHNGSGNSGDGGIALYSSTNNTIDHNTSSHNNGDGIFVDSTSTGNTISHNKLRHNTNFDAEDQSTGTGTAGTGNTWTKNHGKTSSPPGLVS
ncbi:MAG TPA: right-handed parallel beta-helix repeat-containing protein [Gemmataceae bacterium]